MREICKDFGQDEHLPFSALLPPNSLRTLLLFYFGRKLQFRSDPGDIKVRGRGILRDINDTGEKFTVKGQETLMFFFQFNSINQFVKLGLCATLLAPPSVDAWRVPWGDGN